MLQDGKGHWQMTWQQAPPWWSFIMSNPFIPSRSTIQFKNILGIFEKHPWLFKSQVLKNPTHQRCIFHKWFLKWPCLHRCFALFPAPLEVRTVEVAMAEPLTSPENKTAETWKYPEKFMFERRRSISGGVIPMKSHDHETWAKLTISFPHKFLQTSCYPVCVPENANFKRIGSKHPNSLWHDHGPPWHKIIGFSQIRLRLTLGMMQIEWLHDETKQRSMQSWEYNRLQTSPISDLQVDVLS